MRSFTLFVSVGVSIVFAACGGAADSPLLGDGGDTQNDGSVPPNDGATNDTSTNDTSTSNCDVTKCATIPAGFTAVRLSDEKTACPNDWTSTAVVSSPVAADGTCSCACNVTQAPTCLGGNITRSADATTTATCGTPATTFLAASTCTSINGNLYLTYDHYQTNPPPAQGGVCHFDSTTDTSKITTTAMNVCQPPSACVGEICGGEVCVQQSGDVACPTDFPTKTLVGKSATATCGACSPTCAAKATCGGTLSFFTDSACTTGEADFTADGTCTDNPAPQTGPYTYLEYKPSSSTPTCDGNGPPPQATPSLDSPTTVCCK